jgi:hypothetical protein
LIHFELILAYGDKHGFSFSFLQTASQFSISYIFEQIVLPKPHEMGLQYSTLGRVLCPNMHQGKVGYTSCSALSAFFWCCLMFLLSIHETVPKKTQARATEDNGFVVLPRVQIE